MAAERPDIARRARFHAALGDPIRLAIVDDLANGDRSPGEIAHRLALAGNLLAHHLDVLDEAGLIERRTSSADRRRKYVRLTLPHGWHPEVPAPTGPVVFVCSRNMARSQLAASIWRARNGGPADSAGTHPADRIHPEAIAAAQRRGIDFPIVRPRPLRADERAGQVITVCDRAHEELDAHPHWLHWSIPDPVDAGTSAAFDAAADELDDRITELLARSEAA